MDGGYEGGVAGRQGHGFDLLRRAADHPHGGDAEPRLDLLRAHAQRARRQGEEVGIGGALEGVPAEGVRHARQHAVGVERVPVVVEAPDDQVVLRDEGRLAASTGSAASISGRPW